MAFPSNYICTVPEQVLQELFNYIAMLQILFPQEHNAYYRLPVGCRTHSDLYYREKATRKSLEMTNSWTELNEILVNISNLYLHNTFIKLS